ncbi:MAG: type III pantothenate kinase, partial [Anaerolineae bacterium]|nr:type III pantothenate kinase [Anaerolineae bacterium]MDW8072522.1 type III pantothenate kinase [Anaerolineae bacterium]
MLFCIDLGNTNITLGLYQEATLRGHWRVRTDHHKMPDEYGILMVSLLRHAGFAPHEVSGVCMCSVVPPLTGILDEACRMYLGHAPLIVDASVNTGVKICYDNPREVGADRVVDAVAVYRLYGAPACVVDFGTATTFDAISRTGEYLGGAIAPGLGIAAEALFSRTAKLPRIDLVRPPGPIGRNTVHSMQSGLIFGYVGLVEGMVARFRKELGDDMRVIGTGGLVEIIARETDVIQT